MPKALRGSRGFSLIEVMIASGLVTVVLGSLFVLLADYNQLFRQAQERNVFITIRRRVVQSLNRRDAWIVTYQTDQSFQCLLGATNTCTNTTDVPFTVYGNLYPPTAQSIVFTNFNPPTYSFSNINRGFTVTGEPCVTFQSAVPAAALRCPIRLEVTWTLVNFGLPSSYYPTGYFPSGYYQNVAGGTYYPGAIGTYFWFGTLGAQVEVRGRFKVHPSIGDKVNLENYDFKLIKQVP